MAVLVTGGAGYIGSHMVLALLDTGEKVVVLDNLSTGLRHLVDHRAAFVLGNVSDRALVSSTIREYSINAVVHFAGSVIVPESVENPLLYYENNTAASLGLVGTCLEAGIDHFIFSSTAAVYGAVNSGGVSEDASRQPINPYGRSKLITEWMLQDISNATRLRYIALRYFNVAGADPLGRTGQSTPRATHLIKRACQVALGKESHLEIFGTDFATPDGTGVRDYIHVTDLVAAHLLALNSLRKGSGSDVFNCGYGRGHSVLEIVRSVERISERALVTKNMPRRAGDPAMVIAESSKLLRTLGWTPKFDEIDTIVSSAMNWERNI